MLTLFSIPKPFAGHIGVIQRNALASWRRLAPDLEVVLFGSDEGVADAARDFGARHEPGLPVNRFGTPLVSAAFTRARQLSDRPFLMYSNADMLYDRSLFQAIAAVRPLPAFLLSGRRWDLDITADLAGAPPAEWDQLFASAPSRGQLHGPAGMDFFVFPRAQNPGMPEFAVGRAGWDSWLVWQARMRGIPVVDATRDVTALHQNHDYSSLKLGYQHWRGPERDLNVRAAGGLSCLLTLREASHELVAGRLQRPDGARGVISRIATWRAYNWSLAAKRWVLHKFN